MCGAPASTDATCCEHCGARLATVACPSCFGINFLGSKFCSHCGAKLERKELDKNTPAPCPRCGINMQAVVIGTTNLRECPKCEGLWAARDSLDQICADREKQAALLGVSPSIPPIESGAIEDKIRYLPCPECHQLMNRINFAHVSNVIVDVCKTHGTWFDRDELRRIVEFIRSGGFDAARAREIAALDEKRRELKAAQRGTDRDARYDMGEFSHTDRESGFSIAAALVDAFLGTDLF
jgi:Zn-finger nucleic acid-binding protein